MDKIVIEKNKTIQETPISPINMSGLALNCIHVKRPVNPEPPTPRESSK